MKNVFYFHLKLNKLFGHPNTIMNSGLLQILFISPTHQTNLFQDQKE